MLKLSNLTPEVIMQWYILGLDERQFLNQYNCEIESDLYSARASPGLDKKLGGK